MTHKASLNRLPLPSTLSTAGHDDQTTIQSADFTILAPLVAALHMSPYRATPGSIDQNCCSSASLELVHFGKGVRASPYTSNQSYPLLTTKRRPHRLRLRASFKIFLLKPNGTLPAHLWIVNDLAVRPPGSLQSCCPVIAVFGFTFLN